MSHFVLARESCVGRREAVDEALTAARVGRALSTEIHIVRSAEAVIRVEGNTGRPALARGGRAPRCPRPQGTHVRPTPGPGRPSSRPGRKVGAVKVKAGAERRDARLEGVGLGHSSEETGEQSSGCAVAESAERRAGRNGSSQQAKHGPDTEPDFPRHRRLRDTAVPKGCRHDRSEEPGALAGTPGSARGASGNRRPTATNARCLVRRGTAWSWARPRR